ncbi:MAG: hypothetical protein ACI9C4_001616 [Paraglaciecola sp.]|jgi:hypothetical protein
MLRAFIFCDICNRQGLRYIEQNRSSQRGDEGGRRVTDGRSWYEGTLQEALNVGWVDDDGQHICPHCHQRAQLRMIS